MSDTGASFLGTNMEDIYCGRGPWSFETPPINVSRHHAVLYELPVTLKSPPKPHISSRVYHWDSEHVRMPYSPQNLFAVEENGEKQMRERWGIIEAALLQPIQSSRQFEATISSYNQKLPKFLALHNFFEEVLEEEDGMLFFNDLLPKIIGLALRLPEIVPGSLPLLKQGSNKSISLSQLQIASLLANAFLCIFPWRKDIAASYPGVNFVRLFAAHLRPKREQSVSEKLKCICHYFRRVTDNDPVGVVTFERKSIPKSQLPEWSQNHTNLGETKLHVTSKGFIEDDGLGLLQVDFANRNVGGGVLGFGCVQEEIRYIICPELIISRLFTEQLGSTEALVITGVERYSKYGGYGDSFTWEGDYNDTTPYDAWGRRRTTIVAIDALRFNRPMEQYNRLTMLRELNKAYAGFHSHLEHQLPAVATGNWGCGAYQGDPRLKALLQLMACSATCRNMVYYTFENDDLRDDFYKMHSFIVSQQIKVSQLWKYLVKFSTTNIKPEHLYPFLQQAHLDSKMKPSLKTFFGSINLKKYDHDLPSTSANSATQYEAITEETQSLSRNDSASTQDIIESSQNCEEIIDTSQEIIESSQPEICSESIITNIKDINRPNVKEQNAIIHMFNLMDSDDGRIKNSRSCERHVTEDVIEIMDTSETNTHKMKSIENKAKCKITDYFLKVDKG